MSLNDAMTDFTCPTQVWISPLAWRNAYVATHAPLTRYLVYRSTDNAVFRTLPWIPPGGWDPGRVSRNVLPPSHGMPDHTQPMHVHQSIPPMQAFQRAMLSEDHPSRSPDARATLTELSPEHLPSNHVTDNMHINPATHDIAAPI